MSLRASESGRWNVRIVLGLSLLSSCDPQDSLGPVATKDASEPARDGDAGQNDAGTDFTDQAPRDASTDASLSLPALSNVPAERLYQVVELSDRQCKTDTDCAVFYASASCIEDCTVSALSRDAGVAHAYATLAGLETELCKQPDAAASIDPTHGRAGAGAACPRDPDWFAHCRPDQGCTAVSPICPSGCAPSGDRCTGPSGASCDGCPTYPSELSDQPCSELGKICNYGQRCGISTATCQDQGKGPRWTLEVFAC